MSVEEIARAEYNALPTDMRLRVAYFRNLERIAELERQRARAQDRFKETIRQLDQTIERVREAMKDGREMFA